MHQDAHEFLHFLLNNGIEILLKQQKTVPKKKTFIHDVFEGTCATQIRCTCCEHVSTRKESFLDLSIDVSQNASLTQCLKSFSSIETLKGNNKFFCETCNAYQEAQKSTKISKLPQVLTLHLKRFKFFENTASHKKLPYRVAFPFELRLPNADTGDKELDTSHLYQLYAIVVHIGSDPNVGHYKCIIRSNDVWMLFDDDLVDTISESQVANVFGFCNDQVLMGKSETAYILYYTLAAPRALLSSSTEPPATTLSTTNVSQSTWL